MNFVSLDGSNHLKAEPGLNIAAANQVLFPFLDWILFAFLGRRKGDYVDPVSTVLFRYAITEGEPLLVLALDHLRQ